MERINFKSLYDPVFNEDIVLELTCTISDSRIDILKSQKAKSYLLYDKMKIGNKDNYSTITTELILLNDNYHIVKNAFGRLNSKTAFLRSCPKYSRHGVLESIKVTESNLEENWLKLRNNMLNEDPDGCMMLQPFIPATSSMVMVPNIYAWVGPDHDGITAGKAGVILNYLMNSNDMICANNFAEIGHQPNTYELEYVYLRDKNYLTEKYANGKSRLTQIRGSEAHTARAPPFTYDKIVDGEIVKCLSEVTGAITNGTGIIQIEDFWQTEGLEDLAWIEANITKDKMGENFVISHPNGSLGSHVYAHCRSHGIPYIVNEVNIGETWVEGSVTWVAKQEGVSIDPKPYNPFLPDELAEFNIGLERNLTQWRRQQGWFAHYFHQWISGQNMNPKYNARLSGAFSGWLVKAAVGLCLGELRFAFGMKNDISVDFAPTLIAAIGPSKFVELNNYPSPSSIRKHYYVAIEDFELTYVEMEKALRWCAKQFNSGWNNRNYGGTKWGNCATGAADLCNSIIKFMNDKNENNIKRVIYNANKAENFAHNNGSLYNKFIESAAFDCATLKESTSTNGWFTHSEKDINRIFKTYEVTRTFLEETFVSERPTNDWNELFDFVLGVHNPLYYRKNEICGEAMFPPLRDAALAVLPTWLHHKNKYTLDRVHYIRCGNEECSKCEDHNINSRAIEVGGHIATELLAKEAPSAFFALDYTKSSISTYTVAHLIKHKLQNLITPKMFVESWDGLNKLDPMYNLLANILKKYITKMASINSTWIKETSIIYEKDNYY